MPLILVIAVATLSKLAHADQISSVPGLRYTSTEVNGVLRISNLHFQSDGEKAYSVRLENKSGSVNVPHMVCSKFKRQPAKISLALPKYSPKLTGGVVWSKTRTDLGTMTLVPQPERIDRWHAAAPSVSIDSSRIVLAPDHVVQTSVPVDPRSMTENDFLAHPELRSMIIVSEFDCI